VYDYFKLGESEQYQFLQLPWLLIKDAQFKKLSDSSKILYSLMLNRTSLSAKNGWVDEQENIYIIYTIEQIMEDLCCAVEKATKVMKELKDIGLIKTIRRGLGKPNLLYVMNFATSLKYQTKSPTTPINPQTFGNRNSELSEIEIPNIRKSKSSNINYSNTNYSNTESSQRQTEEKTEEKTDMTMTNDDELSAEEITLLENQIPTAEHIQTPQQVETTKYNQKDYDTYKNIIKENIDYQHHTIYNHDDIKMIDGLIEIMLDVILTENPSTTKIGKETKSRDIVRAVYLRLKNEHIQHVIDRYKEQHHQITHKNAYLRTMLYTVYQEHDAYYINQVRADGIV